MWTDKQRTKTNPKTSPEQSAFFQLVQEINKTNCSITRKTTPSPWKPYIYKTNLFTKFHDDWATGGHVFSPIWTIFKLVLHINKSNVLINFHDDWAKIETSQVFTRKTAPPTGNHFQWTGTTFELNQHIIKTDIKTKLHEDWALNVTCKVFKLDRDIIGTNLLTKFHEDRTINVASRVFTNKFTKAHLSNQETKVLTKFHENWAKNVTSRVLTCFHYIHIEKIAQPTGGHVFSQIWTIF
ncbi:hypothetical protein DPMN_117500 [Dreissena polymorpha]|uniref:Uncharacterized protein n=1 Tax=Dreissena polymorpha TaxID=45954 RepID=A0A9D4KQ00_DREPO|nr:hypothetical protein DPMN_117500 [Dreissena polymorpha]